MTTEAITASMRLVQKMDNDRIRRGYVKDYRIDRITSSAQDSRKVSIHITEHSSLRSGHFVFIMKKCEIEIDSRGEI